MGASPEKMREISKLREADVGIAPIHLRVMRRVLKTSAGEDRSDGERQARRWFMDDPLGFMKAVEAAEQGWLDEMKSRRKEKRERRAAARTEVKEEGKGKEGPPVVGGKDEGVERCVKLAREVLGRLVSKEGSDGGQE